MINKKNLPLILGLAIPIVMIGVVVATIYIPRMYSNPQYDFLYANANYDPYCVQSNVQYFVENGVLKKKTVTNPNAPLPVNGPDRIYCAKFTQSEQLFLHDIQTNTSTEIAFEDAQKLKLEPTPVSPDGFEIVQAQGGNFPFGSVSDYNARYLTGHGLSKKLQLRTTGDYYFGFNFLGWVKE